MLNENTRGHTPIVLCSRTKGHDLNYAYFLSGKKLKKRIGKKKKKLPYSVMEEICFFHITS